ncbi:RDD family protein, partial [uncultured Nocardioides sp.]|uniref:RDD family protein n=1 Tax=uncultured Nocardioides sp. TaxID=198441 RepID=UPI0025FE59A4
MAEPDLRTAAAPERAAYAALTTDDLVTGEAVALDLRPAGLPSRLLAGVIDAVVLLVGLLTLGVLATTVETLTRGKSLGKWAMGLRAVRDDAGPITFQHAFVRALIGFVEIYAFSGAPAFFSAMLSSRGKRLGDYAAGTYVVRDRVRLSLPHPVEMPRELATWARSA